MRAPAVTNGDRRRRKSVAAIGRAFADLLDERGLEGFGIADIVTRADIARSTFYRYYANKEEVFCAQVEPMLAEIAACVSAQAPPTGLAGAMDHLWANRAVVRTFFAEPALSAMRRTLARLIQEERAGSPPGPVGERLLAGALAMAALGLIEEWLGGRERASAAMVARALHLVLCGASRAAAGKQQL
jgi:AcrR family transcriptional regulator